MRVGRGCPRSAALLDDLGGLHQDFLGDGQPEGLGSLEVDDEVELGGLLYWEISGFGALEDFVDEGRRPTVLVRLVRAVGHEARGVHEKPAVGYRGQPTLRHEFGELTAVS